MGYISLTEWRDLTDGHLYRKGDKFPFDGRRIDGDRIKALEAGSNRAGLRLITADGAKNGHEEGQKEEAPKQAVKAGKAATAEKAAAAEEKPKRSRARK